MRCFPPSPFPHPRRAAPRSDPLSLCRYATRTPLPRARPCPAGKPPQELRLSAALRRPAPSLSQLDYELLADIRMLRVVKSMIT